MKNSNDTIGNRTRDLPACSAVPQPTAPLRTPAKAIKQIILTHPVYSDSAVGMATRRGLDGRSVRGSKASGEPDFLHPSRPAMRPTLPPVQWVPDLFPGGKAVEAWR